MRLSWTYVRNYLPIFLRNSSFYLNGMVLPALTSFFSFLLAATQGAETRGEFAFIFSFINLTISLFYSALKGRIMISRDNRNIGSYIPLHELFSKRSFAVAVVTILVFFIHNINISFISALMLAVSIILNGELILIAQRLLFIGKPRLAISVNCGAWFFMILIEIFALMAHLKIDLSFLIKSFFLCISLIYIMTFLLASHLIRNLESKKISHKNVKKEGLFTISSIVTILQTNGLILLLSKDYGFGILGVISLATAILNYSLTILNSVIVGRFWLKLAFSRKLIFGSLFFMIFFVFITNFVTQLFLNDDFDFATLLILTLIPYYFSCFLLEFEITLSLYETKFDMLVKFKFLNTLIIIPEYWICSLLGFNLIVEISIISCLYFLLTISFIVYLQRNHYNVQN